MRAVNLKALRPAAILPVDNPQDGGRVMADDPKRSHIQYIWPWLGFAALIGVMWLAFAE
jgi:hypothetical protein